MRRITIALPDDLERDLEEYIARQHPRPSLTAVVQSALRKFLAEAAAAASGPMAMKQVLRRRKEMKVAAAEHGAMRVWGFGSLARREATEQSDVDILVSLEAGRTLFDLARMRGALERLLGVPVDVVTDDSLEGGLADEFLGDAVEL